MPEVIYKFRGMNNVDNPAEVGAPASQTRGMTIFTEAVKLINIDPSKKGGGPLRVGRSLVLAVAGLDSGWSDPYVYNPTEGYFTNGPLLNRIDANGNISTIRYDMIPGLKVIFVQVNYVTVYSNGIQWGVIENGVDTAPFYPPATVLNQLGVYIPSYKERMVPGKFLEYFNGRLYALVDNYQGRACALICSDPLMVPGHIESMDTRNNIVATFDGEGTMLARIEAESGSGLFVGTTLETFWLSMQDAVAYEGVSAYASVAPYGVVPGTVQPIKAERTALKSTSNLQMWSSTRGVCVGGTGGMFINMTQDTVSYPPGQVGTAIVREQDGEVHYICSMKQPGTTYNAWQKA